MNKHANVLIDFTTSNFIYDKDVIGLREMLESPSVLYGGILIVVGHFIYLALVW